uniref:Prenylcysteine lyase domain-containing protein n=1 Tax=Strigamia maritima TaxID=126957 RepID=T1IKD7_STRMM
MDSHAFKSRAFVGGSLLILLSKCLFSTAIPVNSAPRIGIVGAGIGGAMTAHFTRNLFGVDAKIDVYEKSHVGGRLSVVEFGGQKYEAGGSIIHERNRYMADIAKLLKLEHAPQPSWRSGLYNGKEFVFEESSFSYLTYVDLIWRYGLSIIKWNTLMSEMLNHFDNVYGFQEDGYAYTTVDQLLHAMNPEFVNMTQTTTSDFLEARGFSDTFIKEIATAAARVNYGQSTNINAFVGAASLAAAQPSLWSVEGGNYQLAEGALNLSKANLIPAKVSAVTLLSGGTYKISTTSPENSVDKEYDIVVVAAPQTKDLRSISFNGFSEPFDDKFFGRYHQTIATFVEGIVNSSHFGSQLQLAIPDGIISINFNLPYNCLARNYAVTVKDPDDAKMKSPKIYKLFSQKEMSNEQLDILFEERTAVKSVNWLAYPQYNPPEKLGDFKLHDFLYYTSAIEWAGSAMEMSAVAARNAALLAYNEYNDISKNDEVYTSSSIKTEL